MFEKVNRHHPDKIADRIAGAIVDLAYSKSQNPKVACEVLIGHGNCFIINETSEPLMEFEVCDIVRRIAGEGIQVRYMETRQDSHLSENQVGKIRCGDNGIFKGVRPTLEEELLCYFASRMDYFFDSDGKYIINWHDGSIDLIICQSAPSERGIAKLKSDLKLNPDKECLEDLIEKVASSLVLYWLACKPSIPGDIAVNLTINPLGDWTGGTNVDTGATNRKLGSDMGRAVTGGGLHGKDLSKADVSVNIFAHIMAEHMKSTKEYLCAIGDEKINDIDYDKIVDIARSYVRSIGGFEKLAEYGLLMPENPI